MKLQTPTVTEFVNLGIKLETILFQSRILCQFNSIFSEKSYIKSFLNKLWWVDPAVLPDSLEIAFFLPKVSKNQVKITNFNQRKNKNNNSVKSGHSAAIRKNPD